MLQDLPIGQALRRFRLLNGLKQSHLAELLQVSQGVVSRWESGSHAPQPAHRAAIAGMIAAHTGDDADAALKRLVSTSSLPVHLVCDATHRLLAVSPARAALWKADTAALIGTSLWPFASAEIVASERELAARGWYEQLFQRLRFHTGPNDSDIVAVQPGLMEWETIPLSDGRIGRLTTSLGPASIS